MDLKHFDPEFVREPVPGKTWFSSIHFCVLERGDQSMRFRQSLPPQLKWITSPIFSVTERSEGAVDQAKQGSYLMMKFQL